MTKTSYSGTGSDRFLKAKNYISAFIHLRHFHIHIRAEHCPIAMAEKLIFQSIVNKCSDYHFPRKHILQFGHLTYFGYSLPIFLNAIFTNYRRVNLRILVTILEMLKKAIWNQFLLIYSNPIEKI